MGQDERNNDDEPTPDSAVERILWTNRRGFLGGAVALTGAAAVEALKSEAVRYSNAVQLLAGSQLQVTAPQKPSFSIDIHRREDFLFLRVDGYNLIRSGQRLMRKHVRLDARLVITFMPQHIAEQAFADGKTPAAPGRTHAVVAAPSRLAFIVPASGIPLTIDGLLSWTNLKPALAPAAAYAGQGSNAIRSSERRRHRHRRPGAAHGRHGEARSLASGSPPGLRAPQADETAIELPWHLALSPTADGRWSHETEPITLNGSTEVWRTQLVTPFGATELPGGAVRAVWNYDTVDGTAGTPTLDAGEPPRGVDAFTSSLDPYARWQIVKASADFTIRGRADVKASQLLLSARGGSLLSNASWNVPLEISDWTHEATQGRDQYVKVVYKGFLFPFGHGVSVATVTQREFEYDRGGSETVGVMRQTMYLVVSNPTVSYDPALNPAVANNGRDFPFRLLELKDVSTPPITSMAPFVPNSSIFSPKYPPFEPSFSWHFVGTDWSGRTTSFVAQAVFVAYDDGVDDSKMAIVRDTYNARSAGDPLRTTDFGGKTLTFAESYAAGDTDLPTYGMTFAASPGRNIPKSQHQSAGVPCFVPTLVSTINGRSTGAQASVSLPAAEQASGAPLNGNGRPTLAYYAGFVENGFYSAEATANQGNVFMEMLGDASTLPSLTFNGPHAGGVLTPNMQLQGLSRSLGPVGDLDNIYKGTFDPSTVFKALDGKLAARILGGVTLADLLDTAGLLDGAHADVPNPAALQVTATTKGNVATTTVTWSPKIKGALAGVPSVITVRPEQTNGQPTYPLAFTLKCTITTDLTQPTNSQYTIHGELDNFIVNLVSTGDDQFISIIFSSFSFDSVSGGKPKLKPKVAGVNFDGALKFVEQLSSFMSLDGPGGPNITSLADAISSDLSIKLPSIDVGILSLSHVAIDTGFKLPFDGGPSLFNFGFSTSDNPFALAIGIFGGGGFLGLSLGTAGVKLIEGSFEFGAMAALDLGVASGAVSIVAGFYFSFAVDTTSNKLPPPTTCVLSGFVKLNGNLNVLGIITLALEFDLTLTYLDPPGSITGTATLVVSVSLLYLTKTVTITASKTFVNGASNANGGSVSGNSVSSKSRGFLARSAAQIAANTPPTFEDQMSQSDWNTYCAAFAPVS